MYQSTVFTFSHAIVIEWPTFFSFIVSHANDRVNKILYIYEIIVKVITYTLSIPSYNLFDFFNSKFDHLS